MPKPPLATFKDLLAQQFDRLELFLAFEVKSSNKNAIAIRLSRIRFNSRVDAYQFPSFGHHCIDFAIDHGVVGCYILETQPSKAVEIEQLYLFKGLHSNVLSIRFVPSFSLDGEEIFVISFFGG